MTSLSVVARVVPVSQKPDLSHPSTPAETVSAATVRSPRRLSADERRAQLFEVALVLFGERGFRATTMDDIAEAAGVTKPLVYQHFASKRALYRELVESVAQDLLTAVQQATTNAEGPRQQVELGFGAYFEMVVSHEEAFRLVYGRDDAGDSEVAAMLRRIEDTLAEAIDPLITAGLEPEHRRLLARAVVGMAEGASRHWINARQHAQHGGGPQEPSRSPRTESAQREAQRLASRLADLAWAGLRSVHAD